MNSTKYSKQREIIKAGLIEYCIHPTAEQLYAKLRPENPNLSLATVYRNLKYLAQTGEIKRIEGLSGQVHYDHNNTEHFHLICVECECITDLPAEMSESLKATLKDIKGFEIYSYDIIVKGICDKCKAKLKGDINNGI